MEQTELLALAREYATTEDLYDLLGIDALEAEDQAKVRRAWRKASLKYHPDKVGGPSGAGFDDKMKAKWELLERAREILSDPKTREAYVNARSAAMLQEQKKAAMNALQRERIEKLEAAEKAARDANKPTAPKPMSDAEIQAIERGKQRVEERKRLVREALERERIAKEEEDRLLAEKEADLERRLEESRQRKEAKKARRAAKEAYRARTQSPTTPSTDQQADAVPLQDGSATKAPSPPPSRAKRAPAPHPKMDALLAKLRARDAEKIKKEQEGEQHPGAVS